MQDVVGGVVFLIVCIIAIFTAGKSVDDNVTSGTNKAIWFVIVFVVAVLGCYLALGVVLSIIYIIAWFGTLIRDVLMWFIEAVLKPYSWVMPD